MRPTFYSFFGTAGLGKENETFLMIFDVGNPCFLEENILHSGCTFTVTEPQYLHAICLNYFRHSFNMLKLYKINFSWIQASPWAQLSRVSPC